MARKSSDRPIRAVLGEVLRGRFEAFAEIESSSGILLMACALLAMLWANSPWADSYFALWHHHISIGFNSYSLDLDLHHWINDGLMALFFFLVGLEIKREILIGELSTLKQAMLPIVAALGGMLVPALIYFAFNQHSPEATAGWGIPMATDIAFALGVLALAGRGVPVALKVFLAALAIIDDLGAVLVIAIFYTSDLNLSALWIGLGAFGLAALANLAGIRALPVYMLLGLVLWLALFQSGIHATIAGVLLALTIPARSRIGLADFADKVSRSLSQLKLGLKKLDHKHQSKELQEDSVMDLESACQQVESPLEHMERALHSPVAYFIMPVFAFANAGIALGGSNLGALLLSPVTLGTLLGLFLGKQLGVYSFSWLAVRLKLAELPANVSWKQVYAVSLLCGIGFTMSLFISNLAFSGGSELLDQAKIGVLLGSLISGTAGFMAMRRTTASAAKESSA
ncbi:Na+/H+ antiporter NhaA [bacterium]|nr:Na+/H+ antiporter NhaA [bacterium]